LGDTPVAVASKHVRDHPPAPRELNPSIPPTFEAIILKAMAKNPEHRYATAEDLRADLLRFNEGRTVLAMDDATSLLAVAGTTQVVGAVGGMDATQSVAATPADASEEEEGGTNRTRTYAIILAVLIILLLVAGYFLARNLGYLGGSASFNLRSVTGEPVAEATSKLTDDGLVVKDTSQISTDAPGTVISTDPPPNSLVKKGDTVTLTVATAQKVTVPAGITQTSLSNAESLLQSAGLGFTVTNVPNNATLGTVLSSTPPPGARVAKGSTVALSVSSGPKKVPVPSLIGLSQPQALSLLEGAGLNVGNISQGSSSNYGAGEVIASTPSSGQLVDPGSSVNIVVSTGSPPTTTTTTTAPPPTTTTSAPPPTTTTTTGG
jgi:beta-lactam-binding protein with PASTA domain